MSEAQQVRFGFGKASGFYGIIQSVLTTFFNIPGLPFGLPRAWEELIYSALPQQLAQFTVFALNALLGFLFIYFLINFLLIKVGFKTALASVFIIAFALGFIVARFMGTFGFGSLIALVFSLPAFILQARSG